MKDLKKKRLRYDIVLRGLCIIAAAVVGLLALSMTIYVLIKGVPELSWKFLTTSPSYLSDVIGILPDILNTLYLVLATLLLVLPLGVGAAIYLTEYAKSGFLTGLIERAAETLAGIPSIIFGLVGMLVFVERWGFQTSLLAGSATLALMNLPIIIRTTQESLKMVPDSYREGALALGAGKWRMVRTVVLPPAKDGIVTGAMLAIGRILGESAALLFTAGLAHVVNGPIKAMGSSGASLSVALYVYAKERGEFGVAFGIAAVLLILALILNGIITYQTNRKEVDHGNNR